MRGVGPGTVLGGRYTVRQRLEQTRGTERWSADDTTLGRSVSVLAIPAADHRTPALLDGARRAASVSHSVFVRVLDVGTDDEVAYVVEEQLAEARTLSAIVSEGGIPADEVRRITGEAAAALEAARQRGMHHLDLTPDDVLRTPEGEVRLRGLEVAGVRAGEEATDPDEAARRDAVGVVALAYAGLTGLWPLGAGDCGLGQAPRVPGGVASPSELAAGVPRDLDALCRLTLNDDQGPTSPGDYARQVAPWPSRQVIGRPVAPRAPAAPPTMHRPADPAAPGTPAEPDRTTARESGTDGPGRGGGARVAAGAAGAGAVAAAGLAKAAGTTEAAHGAGADATSRPGPGTAAAAASAGSAAAGTRTREGGPGTTPEAASHRTGSAAGAASAGAESTGVGHRRRPSEDDGTRGDASDPSGTDSSDGGALVPAGRRTLVRDGADNGPKDAGSRTQRAGALAAGAGTMVAGAGSSVAGALGSVGGRVSHLARRAVDKVSELSPDTQRADSSGDLLEAPAPMVPAEPLTKDESKLALFIVAAFVIFALVIGIYGVSRIGQGSTNIFGPAAAPVTRTTTVAPSGSESASGDGSAAPIEPLAILKVQAYDPLGDGMEHDELTGKVYDGNPDTGWYTESYSSPNFGGIKEGVGLVVDLGPNKKPRKVELTIPNDSGIQVYVGPDPTLDGATMIGEKDPAKGKVTFDVPEDVTGQYVIIWYTKAYPDGKGGIRGTLNEVVVYG